MWWSSESLTAAWSPNQQSSPHPNQQLPQLPVTTFLWYSKHRLNWPSRGRLGSAEIPMICDRFEKYIPNCRWLVVVYGISEASNSRLGGKFYIRNPEVVSFLQDMVWKFLEENRKGFGEKTLLNLSLQHKCPRRSGEFAQLAVEPIWRHRMSKVGFELGAPLSNKPFY